MARVLRKKLIYHYGDTFEGIEVLWKDANGNPINLAGYTATMRVKAVAGAGTGQTTLLILSSAGGDGLVIDAGNGKVTISATPTKMTTAPSALVQGQRYFYDLQVKNVAETQTLLEGEFWVDPEVTTD